MNTISLALGLTLLNIQFAILGNTELLKVTGFLILADLITGIIKAVVLKKARSSEGYRKTVVKITQYGGAISISFLLKYLTLKNVDLGELAKYIDYFTNLLQLYILLIELTSIFENLYQVDKTSPFSKKFIQPILRLLTFQINKSQIRVNEPEKNEKVL
jgi:phage-related holin